MFKGPKQTFLQSNIKTANTYMKVCSTSLIIREIKIKTTMRYHLTPVRMVAIKKTCNNKCVEKRESWHTVGEIVNWYSYYRKQYGVS
jgi:hypothetical protein